MPRTGFESRKAGNSDQRNTASQPKKSFRKRSDNAPTFDSISPPLLAGIICLATTYGASPTFSYTRDGTSLVIAVYYQNERYVDYLAGNDDVLEWFGWLTEELLNCSETDLKPYAFTASKKA